MSDQATMLLDVGGQGCRALAVDDSGTILFKVDRAVATREHNEHVEQDADELTTALDAVIAEAAAKLEPIGIKQAALAVQRGTIVCWDRSDGAALSPVISWRDRRGMSGMQRLAAQAEAIRRRTGLRFSPYGGASKIAWCLHELPQVRQAREQGRLVCGPLGSFLLARLLAEKPARVDDTLAQRTLLWSRETFDWDAWLLEQFGLSSRALPDVVASRSEHGHLRQAKNPVPVNLLMGDQNCVPFLDGRPDPDTLYINLGTGAFVLRPLHEPVDDERFQLTLLDRDHECRWALEGSVHGAASAIAWLERTNSCTIPHEHMNGLPERVPDPPLFINSIDGLGAPWWTPGPEPGFVGEHDRSDIDARLLAVLESIAFLVRACVDAMNDHVTPPSRIVLSGGLSHSITVCDLIAELLDGDTFRLDSAEGTALGLWCRLHDKTLNRDQFPALMPGNRSGLKERYARWLKHIQNSLDCRD